MADNSNPWGQTNATTENTDNASEAASTGASGPGGATGPGGPSGPAAALATRHHQPIGCLMPPLPRKSILISCIPFRMR